MAILSSYTPGIANYWPARPDNYYGQIFTVAAPCSVNHVHITTKRRQVATTGAVSLYSTSEGFPDELLGSIVFDASGWSETAQTRQFTFDESIPILAGTYVVVFTHDSGNEYNGAAWGSSGEAGSIHYYDGLWHITTSGCDLIVEGTWTLAKPTTPTPANNATGVDFSGFELSWVNGGAATAYDVYIGGPGAWTLVSENQAGTSYTTDMDELETIYAASPINRKVYWRVDATDGVTTVTGDTWNFDARPTASANPTPVNEATSQRLNLAQLEWEAGA